MFRPTQRHFRNPGAAGRLGCVCLVLAVLVPLGCQASRPKTEAPPLTEIVHWSDGGFQLYRNGEPFTVRGAGGNWHLDRFEEAGGNTLRTWGVNDLEREIEGKPFLDYAHGRGLAVVAGIWVGHERHGFDYPDPEQVEEQRRNIRREVEKYRDHPAILLWGAPIKPNAHEKADHYHKTYRLPPLPDHPQFRNIRHHGQLPFQSRMISIS